jgi:hypothetical protein
VMIRARGSVGDARLLHEGAPFRVEQISDRPTIPSPRRSAATACGCASTARGRRSRDAATARPGVDALGRE